MSGPTSPTTTPMAGYGSTGSSGSTSITARSVMVRQDPSRDHPVGHVAFCRHMHDAEDGGWRPRHDPLGSRSTIRPSRSRGPRQHRHGLLPGVQGFGSTAFGGGCGPAPEIRCSACSTTCRPVGTRVGTGVGTRVGGAMSRLIYPPSASSAGTHNLQPAVAPAPGSHAVLRRPPLDRSCAVAHRVRDTPHRPRRQSTSKAHRGPLLVLVRTLRAHRVQVLSPDGLPEHGTGSTDRSQPSPANEVHTPTCIWTCT